MSVNPSFIFHYALVGSMLQRSLITFHLRLENLSWNEQSNFISRSRTLRRNSTRRKQLRKLLYDSKKQIKNNTWQHHFEESQVRNRLNDTIKIMSTVCSTVVSCEFQCRWHKLKKSRSDGTWRLLLKRYCALLWCRLPTDIPILFHCKFLLHQHSAMRESSLPCKAIPSFPHLHIKLKNRGYLAV